MKTYVVSIGYDVFEIQTNDIGPLFELAGRMRRISRDKYTDPYRLDADSEPFGTNLQRVDFEETPEPPTQDESIAIPEPPRPAPDEDDIVF